MVYFLKSRQLDMQKFSNLLRLWYTQELTLYETWYLHYKLISRNAYTNRKGGEGWSRSLTIDELTYNFCRNVGFFK